MNIPELNQSHNSNVHGPDNRKLMLIICFAVLTLISTVTIVHWLKAANPWKEFVEALRKGDVASANSFCDLRTLKVDSSDGKKFQLSVRADPNSEWIPWLAGPLEVDRFVESYRPANNPSTGDVDIGQLHSVMYGHLVVHEGKLMFTSDLDQMDRSVQKQ